jgi:hypothetical protein
MTINFDALLDDIGRDDGPTVRERLREGQKDELLLKALEAVARPQLAPQVVVHADAPAPQVVVQPPEAKKTVAWTFEFERNADGTIKRIHATPKD